VLVIDDSVTLHKLIRSYLDDQLVQIYSAYDGESGITLASSLRPSLIMLDVDMSGLDGFEVCRRLKANVETTSIPVIVLTADFEVKDKVAGLNMGAIDYITKPFKPEELCARVHASLRARRSLDQKAMVDGLTGLWNRQYLDEHLAAQVTLAQSSGRPVAYIAADIDGLRRINSRHGLPLGDEVIRSVSDILLTLCRAQDAVCHLGGGRFGILISVTGRAGAGRLAERLRNDIQSKLSNVRGNQIGVTCSFGVADTLVTGEASLDERAGEALLRAKLNGGNCVSIARPSRVAQNAIA
jgi:diguanylate cyclase (GGDEF)-like protein